MEHWVIRKLKDLADIERAKKNKIYKKGSFVLQVAASKGDMFYLYEDQKVADKYVVFTVKEGINSKYLFHLINLQIDKILYLTLHGLNIDPNELENVKIKFHPDIETQNFITNIFDTIDKKMNLELRTKQAVKDLKDWHLDKMFC